MNFLLSFIPAPYRMLALGLVIAATLGAAALWLRADRAERFKAGAASIQLKWDASVSTQRADAIQRAKEATDETSRRITVQKENDRVQAQALASARAATDRERVAAQRLRDTIYAIAPVTSGRTTDPAIVRIRPSTGAIAEVAGQCVGEYAALAESARLGLAAGDRAAADYDALNKSP